MTGLDRRQLLTAVGAGAGAGLTGVTAAQTEREADTEQAVETTFTATVGSGFLVIDGSGPGDQDATANIALENLEGDIDIEGEIYEDRTWQSDSVSFPSLDPGDLIDAGDIGPVKQIEFDDSTSLNVNAGSITGTYDPEADNGPLVAGSIDLQLDASVKGTATLDFPNDPEVDFEFDFNLDLNDGADIELTTATSGDLEGEAETLGCADPVVRVVNNDFVVPEATGNVEQCYLGGTICLNINDQLELPSEPGGRNFIELALDITWDSGQPQPFAPDPIVGNTPPRDLDCDGRYDDINGDRNLDIADVQALFDHRNDDQLEANAELYDFAETGSGRVSIFDVQALFIRSEQFND